MTILGYISRLNRSYCLIGTERRLLRLNIGDVMAIAPEETKRSFGKG